MTERVAPNVFLERRSYRRRRMMDALRLLPFLGILLFLLPLFWPSEGAASIKMSTAVIYVFLVWFLLICASFGLWRGLRDAPETDERDDPDAEPGT